MVILFLGALEFVQGLLGLELGPFDFILGLVQSLFEHPNSVGAFLFFGEDSGFDGFIELVQLHQHPSLPVLQLLDPLALGLDGLHHHLLLLLPFLLLLLHQSEQQPESLLHFLFKLELAHDDNIINSCESGAQKEEAHHF